MRKKPVHTVVEMIEKVFTFYVLKGFLVMHKHKDLVQILFARRTTEFC